jgi:hypothetical protein
MHKQVSEGKLLIGKDFSKHDWDPEYTQSFYRLT